MISLVACRPNLKVGQKFSLFSVESNWRSSPSRQKFSKLAYTLFFLRRMTYHHTYTRYIPDNKVK